MWRAAGVTRRRRNEHARSLLLPKPYRRDDPPLLVSLALVVAAHPRPDLLARGADADVGLPPALRLAECELLRASRRRLHRRSAAVGHPVPRPARLFDLLPRGNVLAQHGEPDD